MLIINIKFYVPAHYGQRAFHSNKMRR